jgi:dihydrofolate reductase
MTIAYEAVVSMSANPESYGTMGREGKYPFEVKPEEEAHFKRITGHAPIIMGRVTWTNLEDKPLPHRMNIILSRSMCSGIWMKGEPFWCPSPEEVDYHLRQHAVKKVFVIGGLGCLETYWDRLTAIHLTAIQSRHKLIGDICFPWRKVNRSLWNLESSVTEGRCINNTWRRATQKAVAAAST